MLKEIIKTQIGNLSRYRYKDVGISMQKTPIGKRTKWGRGVCSVVTALAFYYSDDPSSKPAKV